jgi:hypothetical protein
MKTLGSGRMGVWRLLNRDPTFCRQHLWAGDNSFGGGRNFSAPAQQTSQPAPSDAWRNRQPGMDMKPPMRAYLWALQNPHISAVNSNLWNETFVRENLSLAGKKVELQRA